MNQSVAQQSLNHSYRAEVDFFRYRAKHVNELISHVSDLLANQLPITRPVRKEFLTALHDLAQTFIVLTALQYFCLVRPSSHSDSQSS